MTTLTDLPLSEIRPGNNDRKVFDPKELRELADSIVENGLAMPIRVRPADEALDGTRYEIVAGERRFRAHELAGLPTIRAIVEPLEDLAAASLMLIENLQRRDLNPVEEAWAYQDRMARFGQSVEDVAKIAGVRPTRVRERLSLLNLAPDVLELTRTGQLGPWFATQMARLDVNRQVLALRTYQRTPNMAWDDFGAMVEKLLTEQNQCSLDLGDVLQMEEYVASRDRGPRKFTRRQLLEVIAMLVDDPSDERALQTAREALAGEPERTTA
jgi:ParB/RepB/Spo0J family partition protein